MPHTAAWDLQAAPRVLRGLSTLDLPPLLHTLTRADEARGTLQPSSLTFTPGSWATAQAVKLTGALASGCAVLRCFAWSRRSCLPAEDPVLES